MEQKAEEAERDLEDIKKCEYMEEHIGEEYVATVIDLSARGITVQLDNYVEYDKLIFDEYFKDYE